VKVTEVFWQMLPVGEMIAAVGELTMLTKVLMVLVPHMLLSASKTV
jgi:hypothetical protein